VMIDRGLYFILLSLTVLSVTLAQAQDFTIWTESPSNPLFGGLTAGVNRAYYPSALKIGSVYHTAFSDLDRYLRKVFRMLKIPLGIFLGNHFWKLPKCLEQAI